MDFWIYNPKILMQNEYITEIFPTETMQYNQKLNAITRCIILLSVVCFIFTRSVNILLLGLFAIVLVIALEIRNKEKKTTEAFNIINPLTLNPFLKKDFEQPSKTNPMGNVLLPSISDNPTRKSALPAFNPIVTGKVDNSTKRLIQSLNPGIKNTDKQLFGDLGDEYDFNRSMWHFYSNPNTKIPNDQGAYAKFLYGDMPSCRGGDAMACSKDNARYNLY